MLQIISPHIKQNYKATEEKNVNDGIQMYILDKILDKIDTSLPAFIQIKKTLNFEQKRHQP